MVTNSTIRFLLTVHERLPSPDDTVLWSVDMNKDDAEVNVKLGLITKSVNQCDIRYCFYAITRTGLNYVAHIKELLNV